MSFEGIHGDTINVGEPFTVKLKGSTPESRNSDQLLPELIIGRVSGDHLLSHPDSVPLEREKQSENHILVFKGDYNVKESGRYSYGIRIIPYNRNLASKQELGMAMWV